MSNQLRQGGTGQGQGAKAWRPFYEVIIAGLAWNMLPAVRVKREAEVRCLVRKDEQGQAAAGAPPNRQMLLGWVSSRPLFSLRMARLGSLLREGTCHIRGGFLLVLGMLSTVFLP